MNNWANATLMDDNNKLKRATTNPNLAKSLDDEKDGRTMTLDSEKSIESRGSSAFVISSVEDDDLEAEMRQTEMNDDTEQLIP